MGDPTGTGEVRSTCAYQSLLRKLSGKHFRCFAIFFEYSCVTVLRHTWSKFAFAGGQPLVCKEDFQSKVTSLTPALVSQLGLLGSPPDPVGCFPMRRGPSRRIVPDESVVPGANALQGKGEGCCP